MKSNELNNNINKTEEFENALASGDNKALAKVMDERYQSIENSILQKFEELKDVHDEAILNARGIFSLTDEEKKFYDVIQTTSPEKGGTLLIPKTIVQRVFEDMRGNHQGVLDLVDFQNTTGASEWLVSVSEKPVAGWGDLCDEITKELKVGFKVVNTLNNKLSAYIPYCRSILDLGYEWQDAYVREYLALGLSSELSKAAISGDGTKKPFGMAYDYDIDNDTATKKTATKLTKLSPEAFAPLFAKMCVNPMGYARPLDDLWLIVDSQTYYKYIYANNLTLSANGIYVTLLDQMGIKLRVTETGLSEGQAILGLPKRQFVEMGFKGDPNGMIEFSDHAFFLEDKRIYRAKLYADGFPKDKNAFALLDLTGLNGTENTTSGGGSGSDTGDTGGSTGPTE